MLRRVRETWLSMQKGDSKGLGRPRGTPPSWVEGGGGRSHLGTVLAHLATSVGREPVGGWRPILEHPTPMVCEGAEDAV